MKTIIAGTRDGVEYKDVCIAVQNSGIEISEVVCGMARGADLEGKKWAEVVGIPVKEFPANWRPNGVFDKAAGHKRNREMAKYGDALIAIWDGKSSGTKGMIEAAQKNGLFVYVHRINQSQKTPASQ